MKDKILAWLKAGKPYEEGVRLYAEYGHNSTVLKNFSRKSTDVRKAKLAYKLVVKIAGLPEKLINMDPEQISEGDSIKVDIKINGAQKTDGHSEHSEESKWKGKIPYKELPPEVRAWINQRVDIEQGITRLSEKRLQIPAPNTTENNDARKELNEKIEKLLGQKNELNIKIKYYEDTQKIAEEDPEKTPGILQALIITRQHNNLKSQRSKYRNKVHGNPKKNKEPLQAGPKLEAAKVKLEAIEKELKEFEVKHKL